MNKYLKTIVSAGIVSGMGLFGGNAIAASDFYKGNTVKIYVGAGAGGGE